MSTKVKCPNCNHEFNVEEAISSVIEKELRGKYAEHFKKEKAELDVQRQKENTQLEKEKIELKKLIEEQQKVINEKIEQEKIKLTKVAKEEALAENNVHLKMQEEQISKQKELLKQAQEKELHYLKKEGELREKEERLKIDSEKIILERTNEITNAARKMEQEKMEMHIKEKDKKIEDMQKLVEEMKRKSEQGSMQLQGEVQELALEEMLRSTFPFDLIEEVAKGVKGADAIQTVRNQSGVSCGKIIYESKRTKAFSKDWIEKLKVDLRSQQADIAILVTETMPKEMDKFGQRDGIWICTYGEVKSLALVLRESIIKVNAAMATQENKGDKMVMLYNYLTGSEFSQQITAIIEGFESMRMAIFKERQSMERLWKEREKQLDKVLINASGFYGSVKGIAGSAMPDIKLLESAEE